MRSSSDVAGRHPGKGSEKRVRQNREGTALLVELCGRYAPVPAGVKCSDASGRNRRGRPFLLIARSRRAAAAR